MRRLLILLSLCVSLFACQQHPQKSFTTVTGDTIDFSALQGKWVVINYFASWCGPCYKEVPELNAFYQHHKDRPVVMVGVNFDQVGFDELAKLIKKMGITYPVVTQDPGPLLGIDHIPGIPATYLVTPSGKLLAPLLGEQTAASLQAAMQAS